MMNRSIRGALRRAARCVGLSLSVAALVGLAGASALALEPVRITPLGIEVQPAVTLPAEVQALETQSAPNVIDRDTTTEHTAYASSRLIAQLETATEIRAIKTYGPAPYIVNVKALVDGNWEPIAGLQNLDLTQQSDAWRTFPVTGTVTTSRLAFDLTPALGSNAVGLKAIEIWSSGTRVNFTDGTALLTALRTTTRPDQGRLYTATPSSGVIGGAQDNLTDNTFRFTLDRNPGDFKRVFLAFDSYGVSHWAAALRSINGRPAPSRIPLPSVATWTTQVEAINPDWLQLGANEITFSVPQGSAGTYSVQNVYLVGELDAGANFIEDISIQGPGTADPTSITLNGLRDGDLGTGSSDPDGGTWTVNASDHLWLTFDRSTQVTDLSFYAASPMTCGFEISGLVNQTPSVQPPSIIADQQFTTGWNTIPLPGLLPADGMRLSYLCGNPPDFREIIASGSGVGTAWNPAQVTATFPDAGQYYGRSAYLRGFVQPVDNGSGPAEITIAGQPVQHNDGAFSHVLSKNDVGLGSQADSDPWSLEIKARYPDGQTAVTTLQLNQALSALGNADLLPGYNVEVSPNLDLQGPGQSINYDGAALLIPPGAVPANVTIGVTPLSEDDLPALDPGLTNVTQGPRRGYRFTPSPYQFLQKIQVKLPYDKTLIPIGLTEQDVNSYYFDEQSGHWVALERVSVDTQNQVVISLTDHFTDMINGTVTVPDHPDAVSFNPTQIKDIKAADPGAQVNLIEVPRANNMGDARLSYPLEVPPGRGGVQPQLAVQYNSSGGNGWLGMGWDVPMQSITIDTRWGVPRYQADKETETYLLNGEQLTPVAHRGQLQSRTAEKIFHTRVEGQFQRIVRHGTSPANYWWEVTGKDGTRWFYGGDPATGGPSSSSTLTDDRSNVFMWSLREMRDTNNNFMKYHCVRVTDTGVLNGSVSGSNLYLQRITYTGSGTTEGPYTVTFIRDRELNEPPRTDRTIDARGGFKRVTADLLRKVEVSLNGALIRRYQFSYRTGAFEKTLLTSVRQFGEDGTTFGQGVAFNNAHEFSYYDDISAGGGYQGFFASTDWNTQDDDLGDSYLGVDVGPSALGGTEGKGGGFSISLGFEPFPTKYLSFNGMIGANTNRSKGTLSLVDIDGDSLPDKVFRDGGTIRFHRNTVTPQSNPLDPIAFSGSTGTATDMGLLSEDESLGFNFGGQVYVFGLNLIGDTGHSLTTQRSYISDVNGDGLMDVVRNGQVFFNRWENKSAGDYDLVFNPTSAGTEFPIGAGTVNASGMLPEQDFATIETELLAENPLADVVRRWTAPFSGRIAIEGDVRLIDVLNDPAATQEEKDQRAAYTTADGVRVAIERPGLAQPLWKLDIAAGDFTPHTPTNAGSLNVSKGDVIYFRVQSQFDGAYDEVSWTPSVRYLQTLDGLSAPSDARDINGLNPYEYKADQDFVYAGRISPIEAPFRGKLRISGVLDKLAATSDAVALAVYRFSDADFQAQFQARRNYPLMHKLAAPVVRRSLRGEQTGELNFEGVPDIDVQPGDKLFIMVEVDSNIDLAKLQWRESSPLQLFYTEAYRPATQPAASENGPPLTDEDGNPSGWVPNSPIQVQDSEGTYLIQLAPQFEMNFYPDQELAKAQEDFTATETGWLVVNPRVIPKPVLVSDGLGFPVPKSIFDHDSEMAFTVKQRGELTSKRVVSLTGGQKYMQQQQSFAIPVYKGDRLFFDFSSRDPELFLTLDATDVSVHYLRPQSVVTLDPIPVNQSGDGTSWTGTAGTLTVLPMLSTQTGAPALSGEVVLHVVHDRTGPDGLERVTVVERRMTLSTETAFNPYEHAFDLPDAAGGTFYFRYSIANPDLAAVLEARAVNIAVQPNYNASVQEFSGLELFLLQGGQSVSSNDDGKALLSVGDSAATVAIAPVVKQGGVLVSNVTGEAILTVARRYTTTNGQGQSQVQEDILVERVVPLVAGKRFNPGEHTFDVAAQANDTLVIYFSTQSSTLVTETLDWGLWTQIRRHTGGTAPTATPPSMLYRYGYWGLFANAYRGWAHAGYNSQGEFNGVALADQPLVPARLVISSNTGDYQVPTDTSAAPTTRVKDFTAFPAVAQTEKDRWFIGDANWGVKAGRMSASRMGLDYVRLPRAADYASGVAPAPEGAGATAVPRLSIVEREQTFGIGFLVNINRTTTPGQGLLDFMDMNGDRFPDVVGGNTIQYTEMVGGLGATRGGTGTDFVRDSDSEARSIAPGGTVQKAVADAKGLFNGKVPGAETPSKNSSFGVTGSLGKRESDVKADYVDLNGDGLPDRVYDLGGTLQAQLNLGYGFAGLETWGSAVLDDSETRYKNAGVSASFNDGVKGYAGSLSLTHSLGKTRRKLVDMNGDGLPDRVTDAGGTLLVGINTGSGFVADRSWTGAYATLGNNQSFSLNGGVSITIPIGPLCLVACFTGINPGVSVSTTSARAESTLQDVNGDGYADRLASTDENTLSVALNTTGRTNLLKGVQRPLGASMEVEYTRDGNTYDQPQSRWVMNKVSVHDGHAGDGVDTMLTTYRYENGFYDRLERDFYGYKTVVEEQRNVSASNALYRSISREFFTDSYYTKGLLKREQTADASGNPFLETENQYSLRDVDSGVSPVSGASTSATLFPQLTRTNRRFFEGQAVAGKSTHTEMGYDSLGNVTRYFDAAETGATDDVEAIIGYTASSPACVGSPTAGPYLAGTPNAITVTGGGALMRHRESTVNCASGNVDQVRQYLETGGVAVTDLSYFANGNLQSVTGPGNNTGQRYRLDYQYDTTVATHVTRISDSFGYASTASHDFKYGRIATTTDLNSQQTRYVYDQVGRVDTITGPYEIALNQTTIAFEYHPEASVPHAITRHIDKDVSGALKPSGTIDTILFTDGIKRVLQTKKDSTIHQSIGVAARDVMIVSGRVKFDHAGRTLEQFYPVTEAKGGNTVFNPSFDSVPSTKLVYDVLDRNTKTTIPDNTATTIAYGFGPDRNGVSQFETTVTDANGIEKRTYRDVRELITSVKEFNVKGNQPLIWTSYRYDPLKQITRVTDDQNNLTAVAYDHFGRRTLIDNPDTGQTETRYDLAGNVTQKITANLRAGNQAIDYDYDFNRLKAIRYPSFPGNNVTYSYGGPGAVNNVANRLTRIVSEMGTEDRQYGPLGEVVYEKKSVVTAQSPNAPETYETRYQYDTWNRMQQLTYPDGEVLTHGYDSGGLLNKIQGVKGSYTYAYLNRLEYDQFEQRVFMEAGNNTRTRYSYDPLDRRLASLSAGKTNGRTFQDLAYTYDNVGNILSLSNNVPVQAPPTFGGPVTQSFDYDDLYRLTQASGNHQYSPNKTSKYLVTLAYDTIHNFTTKQQVHELTQPSGASLPQQKTSYLYNYAYTGPGPHAPSQIGERGFGYDANGNQTLSDNLSNGQKRTLIWDEENRLQSLFDNGHEKAYAYDDQGTRVIKRGPQGETVYVNQFFTARNKAIFTKHVMAGATRLTSKLVKQDTPNGNPSGNQVFEKDQYYYHPDHLGSSSYITDASGEVYEHLQYFPFGETWVQEATNTQRTPYLFTGKELDEETQLYYYGARYYDPRTSVWQSADPIFEKYLPTGNRRKLRDLAGAGGIFNTANLGLYGYGHQNPVRLVDPDGKESYAIGGRINIVPEDPSVPKVFGLPNNVGAEGFCRCNPLMHTYKVSTPTSIRFAEGVKAVGEAIRRNPTPGNDQMASATGTRNDVGPLPTMGESNFVRSFSVPSPDPSKYTDIVVNYTIAGGEHGADEGFVMRFGEKAPDGSITLKSYGEGEAFRQNPAFKPVWGPEVEEVWQKNQQEIIKDVTQRPKD